MKTHKACCDRMQSDLDAVCNIHSRRSDCPDMLISYHSASNEYRMMIHDGGSSGIIINYCPWCGSALK